MPNYNLCNILKSHGTNIVQINSRYTSDIFIGMIYDLRVLECITIHHYACVICTSGTATLGINFDEHNIKQGDMIIKFDTDILIHKGHSSDFEAQLVIFSNDLYEVLTTDLASYRSVFLAEKFPNIVSMERHEQVVVDATSQQFIYILEHLHQNHLLSAMGNVVSVFGKIVFQMIYDHQSAGEIVQHTFSRYDTIYKSFIEQVIKSYRHERTIGFYAEQLNVTPKHLASVVKQVSRRRASEWIDTYVINEAKTLLLSTNKPLYEIAEELNFESATAFSRYFIRLTSFTPRDFRHKRALQGEQ
ncbi:MAG: helix-turn-helix domain-containing protein [Rikenellaceae bacterium]